MSRASVLILRKMVSIPHLEQSPPKFVAISVMMRMSLSNGNVIRKCHVICEGICRDLLYHHFSRQQELCGDQCHQPWHLGSISQSTCICEIDPRHCDMCNRRRMLLQSLYMIFNRISGRCEEYASGKWCK